MSDSYSYSYSDATEASVDTSAMWKQISRIPVDQLHTSDKFMHIEKVMSLVSNYEFTKSDPEMKNPEKTIILGNLLKVVCQKCSSEINTLKKEKTDIVASSENARKILEGKVESQNEEIRRLRAASSRYQFDKTNREKLTDGGGFDPELARLKEENDSLSIELNKMKRTVNEMNQQQLTRLQENEKSSNDFDKAHLEYKHLVSKYKKLLEKSAKTEEQLEEMKQKTRDKRTHGDSELKQLKERVTKLQEENIRLVESRDRAEELCERRESEALKDFQLLKSVSEEMIKQEKLRDKAKIDGLLTQLEEKNAQIQDLENEIAESEKTITNLNNQISKMGTISKRRFDDESNSNSPSDSDGDIMREADSKGEGKNESQRPTAEVHRLERENDELVADVDQLEMRIDAFETENARLNRLIKDYEKENKNEGLQRMRNELEESLKTIEILQSENSQLRERLNNMQDSLTFTAALQELCKRVGVTEEEINSLRPQNAASFNEIDTLKEEVNVLKEEVEWLERDRRHWMNKVRLQPLMDTKLRFELGLTSEQLRQLDDLVDRMKEGHLLVEEDSEKNEDYREKYFQELSARRKDAEHFSEFVKSRIDDAIKKTFETTELADITTSINLLKEHIDVISGLQGIEDANSTGHTHSMTRRLDQTALTIRDNSETIIKLREELAAAIAEKDAIIRERDQYREAIFAAAGATSELDNKDTEGIQLSNSRWATLAKALREQLNAKDNLIASLGEKIKGLQKSGNELEAQIKADQTNKENLTKENEVLHDQLSALGEVNEELSGENTSLKKTNKEVTDGIQRLDSGHSRDVLQKIVLLRRREATLLQRLRRAIVSQEESENSMKRMKRTMDTTFKLMQEAFEGESSGFVLPPSKATHNSEEEMLSYLQGIANSVLNGKLFREDSEHLNKLREVYRNLDQYQELHDLRILNKQYKREKDDLQKENDELKIEVESLKVRASGGDTSKGTAEPHWEAEATVWRQKYTLCLKRLEDKTQEVDMLEKELDEARQDIVRSASKAAVPKDETTTANEESPSGSGNGDGASLKSTRPPDVVAHVSRLEKEIARLKSINLGLLLHSTDLQSSVKALELNLEGAKQEILLIKDSGKSNAVSEFVSAAIREHSSLRKQCELALIQVKRYKVQLAATEANFHIVSNEASAYKLSAYRLYRKYVEQMLSVVDYLRSTQRIEKGSLSPYRGELMDKRYRRATQEIDSLRGQNKSLAMQLSDQENAAQTIEQQIAMLKIVGDAAKADFLDQKLREARSKVRESTRTATECREECKSAEAKIARQDAFIKQLEEEISRMEFGSWSLSPLDETTLQTLVHLKDTVFSKSDSPPLAIQALGETGAIKRSTMTDDPDIAVREYKAALLKQNELSREKAGLQKQLDAAAIEWKKASATAVELKDEIVRLNEKVEFYKSQLDDERQKARNREERIHKSHETQSEVARRATEHNSLCLREMLTKKDDKIRQLESQLQNERLKYVEAQLEEASRMEGLHQRLFSENEAMVERFKEAINGVGQSLSLNDAAPILQSADHSTLSDQLRSLTQEIIRLQSELKTVKTTNIVLESQLAQRIDAAQREANLRSLESATAPFPSQDVTSGGGATAANRPETPKLVENVASPSSNVLPSSNAQPASPAPTAVRESANVEMLTGIIRDQAAMIESLRNREMLLSEQFNQEKEKNVLMAKQVDTDRVREMEKNTTMDLVSSVTKASEPALVGELRAQLVACQQELSMTKEMLAAERNNARSVQIDAAELKSRLDGLQSEISYQQINTDRSKSLVALNEELQKDVNTLKEHNDKLMLASNLLRQKLMDEAQKGGEAARQGRHEIALAQRMGSIQGEALEQMKALEQRVRTFQKELKEKVSNEETIVSKNEDAQRLIFKLHNQLRAKDREIAELKAQRYSHPGQQTHSAVSPPPPQATHRGMQTLSITSPHKLSSPQEESSPSTSAERDSPRPAVSYSKPKVAEAPVKEEDALLQPQIAAIVQREVERNQRENLFQISSLRSSVNRLEKDLAAAREQISSGKSGSKTVRQQLADLRSEKENMEKQHAFELARALRLKAESDAELSRYRANAEKQSTTRSGDPWALVDKLEARIRELESRPQGGLSHYESTTTSPVSPEHLPSAKDVRNHTKIVMQLESALDDLRHKIEVDTPKTENILRFEMAMLKQSLRRLATDLALTKNVGVDSIMRIYGCPSSAGDQNEESLRAEILKKANEVLELKFKTESLNLTVRRLTRHLDTLMQTDSERQTPKDRTQQDQVEVLETVIANLKLVVEKLQAENVLLRKQSKTQTGSGKRWQRESQDVDIGGPRTKGRYNPTGPSTSQEVELRRKLLTAQATAEQYQAELEELRRSMDPERANASSPSVRQWLPTSPPPLPEAPYALRSQETGQRRLSRGDTSASHESMSHHHV